MELNFEENAIKINFFLNQWHDSYDTNFTLSTN